MLDTIQGQQQDPLSISLKTATGKLPENSTFSIDENIGAAISIGNTRVCTRSMKAPASNLFNGFLQMVKPKKKSSVEIV
jgi:hypothetical protein